MRRTLLVTVLAGLALGAAPPTDRLADVYGPPVARVVGAALTSAGAYETLAHLTDVIGPRLSGSRGAEEAVRWTSERLRKDGLVVRTEALMVPRWERGREWGRIIAPAEHALALVALGGSVATSAEGLEAEVVEAVGLEGLARLPPEDVRGRIVLFNAPMQGPDAGKAYLAAAPQRTRGPVEAARLGAVGVLVRSLGTLSARLPHTGQTRYVEGVPPVPAAALSAEDADLIHRLLERGTPVRVRFHLGARLLPDVPSANVVADLPGRERKEEIVLIAAHLDSWDLGTGALDDGAGVAMVMESLRLLKSLGLNPRRTVRGVLYMNEENGMKGGAGYAQAHAAELARHVAALEADTGAGPALGLTARVGPGGAATLGSILSLLAPIGAGRLVESGTGGADITPLGGAGVPLLGLDLDYSRYFDWHHTAGDTLDKVDPRALAQATATMAAVAYVLADMPEPLARAAPLQSPTPTPLPSPTPPPPLTASPRP